MRYDDLIENESKKGITITEVPFKGQAKGYYCDSFIIINSNIDTETEKKCILAEELGHHYTSSGNILDTKVVNSVKQENIARKWASKKLIHVVDFIKAFEFGAKGRYEIAGYLEVTEEFLEQAIDYYKQRYGTYVEIDNYIIYFEPYFGVLKLL